jgi:MFS family permease
LRFGDRLTLWRAVRRGSYAACSIKIVWRDGRGSNGRWSAAPLLRLSRVKIFRPLRHRDFALLWGGITVSLLGDGIYTVAIAWEVYQLSNAPTALAVVGAMWTAPQVLLLLLGGAISDRFDRRHVMMLSDAIRGAAIAVIGVLCLTDRLQLWHVFVLVALYGGGMALFTPAFSSIVPDIVPRDQLIAANSLGQFVRPLAVRFVGPALGGWIVAEIGIGEAFLLDAGSFAASATAFLFMRVRSLPAEAERPERSITRDVREGLAYVRSQQWLWGTLVAVTLAMLFFLGPVWVLVPYVVKNSLHGGADGFGYVLAAGGAGAIVSSLLMGQRGLPRRPLLLVYTAWALSAICLVGYAFATDVWQAMVVSFVSASGLTVGGITWSTVLQRLVPRGLLGRVASVDWLLSFGLAPISYALTGPVADVVGADTTMLWAGAIACGVFLAFLFIVPGVREVEVREPELRPA